MTSSTITTGRIRLDQPRASGPTTSQRDHRLVTLMLRKVLLLSASAGAGHVRAAEAIEKAFKEARRR